MRYAFGINFEGTAALRLTEGGGRIIGLSGSGEPPESTDQWQLTLRAPARGRESAAQATTLAIVSPLGDRIDAVLARESVDPITDGTGIAEGDALDLRFAVAGGTGGFDGATGSIRLHGTLLPQGFLLTADLDVEAADAAWRPPDARPLSAAETAAGGSHVGRQPLSQKEPESQAEADLLRRAHRRS